MIIIMMMVMVMVFLASTPIQARAMETVGTASWYSTEACRFNPDPKCPTASGRSLYELEKEGVSFAAAWNHPLGTRLRVTNVETGKSTEVLVLDRGPNKRLRERVVDLSKKSFEAIGESDRGLIPVRVEVME